MASSFYCLYSLGEGGGCFQHNYIRTFREIISQNNVSAFHLNQNFFMYQYLLRDVAIDVGSPFLCTRFFSLL